MDAKVDAQTEEDGEETDGDLVEVADHDPGQAEGPRQAHQQGKDDEQRRQYLPEVDGDEQHHAEEGVEGRRLQVLMDDVVLVRSVLEAARKGHIEARMKALGPDVVDGLADVVQLPLGELHVGDHTRWINPEDNAVALLGQVVVTLAALEVSMFVFGLKVRHVEGILFIVEADVEGGAFEFLQFDLVVNAPLYVLQVRQVHVEQPVAAEELDLLGAAANDGTQQGALLEGIGQGVEKLDARRQLVARDDDHQRADAPDPLLDAIELADADVVVGQQVGGIRLDLQLRSQEA